MINEEITKNWKVVEQDNYPHVDRNNECFVEVVADIFHVESGQIHQYVTHELIQNGETHPSVFNWQHNNYSCDCNRALFFSRAIGEELDDDEMECSDGKYLVRLKNPMNNEVYYSEFPYGEN